mmetsp:Transcript_29817/g.74541  ORF Transcript_29817/g.74541 Transcript_29817/m.74541 type:complete len:248 (+) Transcript_29817:753-1496(+)
MSNSMSSWKGRTRHRLMHRKVKSSAGTGVSSLPYSSRRRAGSIDRIAIACTPRADVTMKELSSPAHALMPAAHVHTPSHEPPSLSAAEEKEPMSNAAHVLRCPFSAMQQTRIGTRVDASTITRDSIIARGMVFGLLTSEETRETASKPEVDQSTTERRSGMSGFGTPAVRTVRKAAKEATGDWKRKRSSMSAKGAREKMARMMEARAARVMPRRLSSSMTSVRTPLRRTRSRGSSGVPPQCCMANTV